MDLKTIDRISWWIPFKQLRNDVREYLTQISNLYPIEDYWFISEMNKYLKNNKDSNLLDRYKKLMYGLDSESADVVNKIVSNFSMLEDNIYFLPDEAKYILSLQKKHKSKIIKINDECYIYDNKYILDRCFFEFANFYDKIGLNDINNIDYIKNKAIIDAGGFIGDTALILSDYTEDKVYSFEPFLANFESMKKNIKLNNKNNIIPVYMALGDENKEISISDNDVVSSGNNLKWFSNTDEKKVEMVTLDSFVEKNNIKVGLIKTDLEGFEQQFLRGSINTIKTQKPTLIISIYHNYEDFFDIKPMIEDLNLGYKFKIIKSNDFNLILETKLIAEIY